MAKYPHLLPEDAKLWDDFLAGHPIEPKYLIYDVRLGQGVDPGPEYTENIRMMAIGLTQKRADVVAIYVDRIVMYEVSVEVSIRSIGQMYVYPILWRVQNSDSPRIDKVIVTRRASMDIKTVCEATGIEVVIVPVVPASVVATG